jgi:D-3-phosphoglycerate dehydrogenase / 2-oxoglutarate reductase
MSATSGQRRFRVGVAGREVIKDDVTPEALERLERVADVEWAFFDEPSSYTEPPPYHEEAETRLKAFVADLDALVVGNGAPRVSEAVLAAGPGLRLVGDLHGDRFGQRIDVDACRSRGIHAVDTTHGSSYPVSEWALGLMLIGLRNAGSLFRRMVAGDPLFNNRREYREELSYKRGELTGKTVGFVACGHIGRRLLELLEPFDVNVLVYDPHAPRVLADIYGLTLTSLETVMSSSDVVVCLAPLTTETRGLIGSEAISSMRPGTVFVNVSRGAVVDSAALIERLRKGDITACLDVFDPEPVPVDSPVRQFDNAFLTPHIAGVTAACGPRFFALMVDELLRALAGHETRHDLQPREQLVAELRTGRPG